MQGEYGNEFFNPEDHAADPIKMTDAEVRDELRTARIRLMLAASLVDMLRAAYDAMRTHGVNYLELGAYKDTTILDDANRLPLVRGADRYVTWMGRVKNDITAAIARKRMKAVFSKKTPPARNPNSKDHH